MPSAAPCRRTSRRRGLRRLRPNVRFRSSWPPSVERDRRVTVGGPSSMYSITSTLPAPRPIAQALGDTHAECQRLRGVCCNRIHMRPTCRAAVPERAHVPQRPALAAPRTSRASPACRPRPCRACSTRPSRSTRDTQRRVRDAVAKLRYVPHGAARALRSHRSQMVGAVVPSFDYALYARTTSAMQARARRERLLRWCWPSTTTTSTPSCASPSS